MNNIIKVCLLMLLVFAPKNSAQQITGELPSKVQNAARTDYKTSHYYTNKISYKNGGITFNYPRNFFSTPPSVCISFGLNKLKYSSDLKITSIITSNTEFSTAIRVNKQVTGILKNYVSEADTDDVFVYIFAFGE